MHVVWDATETYDELDGRETLEAAVNDALAHTPREHLRQLEAVVVSDSDPRGVALGVYIQDHHSTRIEIYLRPHVLDALAAPPAARLWFLRLHLAHTLFHEVGHHITLCLNRRAEPTRRKAQVSVTLEKWAEEYVEKRMNKFGHELLEHAKAGGADPNDFAAALKFFARYLGIRTGTKPTVKKS